MLRAARGPALIPTDAIRHALRARLAAGTLLRASGRTWIQPAGGDHDCAVCGLAIRARMPECEVADRAQLHAHVSCFKLWAEESRRDAAPPPPVPPAHAGEQSVPPVRDAVVPAWVRTFVLAFTLCAAALFGWGGPASGAPVFPSLGGEPSLEGAGGLLDELFGLENLLRMDDGVDQLWGNPDVAHVRVVAKYSSYDQTIGYRRGEHGGAFAPLVTVSGSGPIGSEEVTFTAAESGADFRWSLQSIGPGAAPTPWSARADENSDQRDHLVTWKVTGAEDHPDNILGSFVIGFEDLHGLGDADYNDVLAQVWGVTDAPLLSLPAPATLVLLLIGSAGAAGWRWRLGRPASLMLRDTPR